MHKLELYERVRLRSDFPDDSLKAGDVATLIDYVPHPEGKEVGCILEIFNALGETIHVAIVPISAIEPLSADEVLTVRSRSETSAA